ncbi:MAG: OmpA family protein, partial [Nitrosomonas sp.]|nr:OmpA family protein [Nitrosomonas sp.]
KAEAAADKGEKKLLDHYIYLSEKHLDIAAEVANRKKNEAYINELSEQRSNLLIQSKTQEAQKARHELEAYKTKESKRGTVLVLDNLLFDTGGATLHRGSQRNLDPLVRYLKDNPERNIAVEGHTDNVGGESYNIDLSFRRAEAVKNYLVVSGIDARRISTKGFGESLPVASNNSAQGKQLNRRVEIVILD